MSPVLEDAAAASPGVLGPAGLAPAPPVKVLEMAAAVVPKKKNSEESSLQMRLLGETSFLCSLFHLLLLLLCLHFTC